MCEWAMSWRRNGGSNFSVGGGSTRDSADAREEPRLENTDVVAMTVSAVLRSSKIMSEIKANHEKVLAT